MMLAGTVLFGTGCWLLWLAVRGIRGAGSRHRRDRRSRALDRPSAKAPRIRPSSLLDPTVDLRPVPVLDPISGRTVRFVSPVRLRTPRAPNPARFDRLARSAAADHGGSAPPDGALPCEVGNGSPDRYGRAPAKRPPRADAVTRENPRLTFRES